MFSFIFIYILKNLVQSLKNFLIEITKIGITFEIKKYLSK